MLDIKKIKENPDAVKAGLRAKEVDCDATVDRILELDGKIRALKTNTETQTAQKNKLAKENGKLFGMKKNEEVHVEIEEGKDLIITLINISDPDDSGVRTITFMFNGAEREIQVQDKSVDMKTVTRRKADPDKAGDIGATLSGSVVKVLVTKGQKVKKGEPLVVTEAMKMETTITSPIDGTVGEIYATKGQAIISGACLLEVLE